MSTLVTVKISLIVTVPVEDDDAERAMDTAEDVARGAMPAVFKSLKDWGADDVVVNEIYADLAEEI